MIRIELGRPRGAVSVRWVTATAIVAAFAAGAGALVLVDRWLPVGEILHVRAASAPAGEAAPEPAPEAPPPPSTQRPRRSDACRRAADLVVHLPEGVALTRVAASADGDYALHGTGFEEDLPALRVAADSLAARSQDVGLSYWRSGAAHSEPYFQFQLSGRLRAAAGSELEAVTAAEALELTGAVEGRARECGLLQVVTELQGDRPVAAVGTRRFQRLSASGSFSRIRRFLRGLAEFEDRARVGELEVVFAPGAAPETGAQMAGQVSVSYEALVTAAIAKEGGP